MKINQQRFQIPRPQDVHSESEIKTLTERIGTNDQALQTLDLAAAELNRLCEVLDLSPEIFSEAHSFYERIINTDIINNQSIARLTSGVVYLACLQNNIPRRLQHISAASTVPSWRDSADESWGNSDRRPVRSKIGQAYRQIADELSVVAEPVEADVFVQWYCSELNLSQDVQSRAVDIVKKTHSDTGRRKQPAVVAAAAVYFGSTFTSNTAVTQRDVSSLSLVSARKIRDRYHEQRDWFHEHEDDFDMGSQPYVGDTPWMKPGDREKLAQLEDGDQWGVPVCRYSSDIVNNISWPKSHYYIYIPSEL